MQTSWGHHSAHATRIVVLGASGMLGSTLLAALSPRTDLVVRGTVRDMAALPRAFVEPLADMLVADVDVLDDDSRRAAIAGADMVVNAVGVIKQSAGLNDSVATVRTNALLPHQLAGECAEMGSRLIHVSTDCVFSGQDGKYAEGDVPDPVDFYGRSKLLGEVTEPALTLRTSIIGHELLRHASLIDWFLSQPPTVLHGYVNAIYTGVTTWEFANLLANVVLPNPSLTGLYHVASEPISKYELLRTVANTYGWTGEVRPNEAFVCDRSMLADRLFDATGYRPPTWRQMVEEMFETRPPWSAPSATKERGT